MEADPVVTWPLWQKHHCPPTKMVPQGVSFYFLEFSTEIHFGKMLAMMNWLAQRQNLCLEEAQRASCTYVCISRNSTYVDLIVLPL